jgi:stearoyl-CoA desaturase (delta-9 desaturase)
MHRGLVHNQLVFHPVVNHVFRFSLWLSFKMWPNWSKFYVAQHRIHHTFSDSSDDVHSPQYLTFTQMFDTKHNDRSRPYYITPEEVEKFAPDITHPTDWIQRNLYDRYPGAGLIVIYTMFLLLFELKIAIIGIFLYWLSSKFLGIIVVNYLPHKIGFGYRKTRGTDHSKNLLPWGIFCCGEELHANHHWNLRSPNYRHFWFEIDLGWIYARILIFFGLAKVKLVDTAN